MSLGVMLAPFVAAGILLFISSQLDEKEHFILRLLFSFFAIGLLLLSGQSVIDGQKDCTMLLNYSVNSYNYTGCSQACVLDSTYNYYSEYCTSTIAPSSYTLFKVFAWIVRITAIYAFVYLTYFVFIWFLDVIKGKG